MMALPYVTAFYAAIVGLMAAALTINVIRSRVGLKVDDGDGGNPAMAMAIRAHANFAQHVPMAILLIGLAEASGLPKISIHVLGVALLVARALSAYGLLMTPGPSTGRQSGAGLTVLVMAAASVLILLRAGSIV